MRIPTKSLLVPCLILSAGFLAARTTHAQETLAERIERVMARPEFAHANFGVEFLALDTGQVLYEHDGQKLFVPASTTKLLTEGTVLAKFGADYRFHTKVYRTGPLDKKGKLKGDLVLVASGDPNLSNRIQPDNTLAFVDEDHAYGGPALKGDPLAVIHQLAAAVKAKGVRQITGRVLIDTSLFPDGPREGGTNVVMSSIMVNDNVIDVIATPGAKTGDLVKLETSPQTSYVRFINQVTTSAAGAKPAFEDPRIAEGPDRTAQITLIGSLPLGIEPQTAAIPVPSPTRFAETTLREALKKEGIKLNEKFHESLRDFAELVKLPDFASAARFYTPENLVAEHISLPLSEEVKVTLKVSQNLHAGMGPYLVGALVGKDLQHPLAKGFSLEQEFLKCAGLDMGGVAQGDGAGGDWADLFAPDFMVHYLQYWTTRSDYDVFFRALPILGKDGTLAKIQTNNAGAGHVFAKTGTFGSDDRLNGKMMLNGKGLAGYVITASGRKLAFAAYVNHVSLPPDPDAAQRVGGQALGEIAAAAYDAKLDQ